MSKLITSKHTALRLDAMLGLLILLGLPQGAFAATPDLFTILTNVSTNLIPDLIRFSVAVAYIAGVWLFVGGLFELKKMGDYRSMMYQPTDFKGPIVSLLFGACLVWLPRIFEVSSNTLFTVSPSADLHDTGIEGTVEYFVAVIFNIMKAVGIIAFIRGWFLLAKTGDAQAAGQGYMSRGIVHVFFGVIAYHLATFTIYTCNTMGLSCDIVRSIV